MLRTRAARTTLNATSIHRRFCVSSVRGLYVHSKILSKGLPKVVYTFITHTFTQLLHVAVFRCTHPNTRKSSQSIDVWNNHFHDSQDKEA